MADELRVDQIGDLACYINQPKILNGSDPGTGKTPPTCVYTYHLVQERNMRVAWVQPKSILKKNRDEMLRWGHFSENDVVIVDGTPEKRKKQIHSNPKVMLMGFDRWSAEWSYFRDVYPDLKANVVDEFHLSYPTMKAKRTENWTRSVRTMDVMVAMSGTFIKGRLNSAYPAIHAVEPRFYGTESAFMNYHADYDIYGNLVGWKNHYKLQEIFRRIAIRHSFKDVYGDEKMIVHIEEVDMNPEQAEAYEEFEENALLELEDGYLDSGGIGGVHQLRCRQILQHPESFGLCKNEVTAKDERILLHLVNHQASGERLVIFASFIKEHERLLTLCQKLGLRAACLNGNIPGSKRGELSAAFERHELDVIIATPKTAGIGLNWGFLNHMIFSNLDYEDDAYLQAYRRGMRGVRDTPLWISILKYRKAQVESRIMAIIERKSRDANLVDPTQTLIKFPRNS